MNNTQILVGVILLLIIVLVVINQKSEHLDSPNLSNEAIQNISSVYANTAGQAVFNNIKVTGNADIANFKGIIVMWSGTNVPSGWTLCDGTNGTPDLRGRFILGSGAGKDLTERKLNEIGGSETHTLTLQEMPKHDHNIQITLGCNGGNCPTGREYHKNILGNVGMDTGWVTGNKQTGDFKFSISNKTNNIGYTSGLKYDSQGENKPHNNMPPFYVLAYIMKV